MSGALTFRELVIAAKIKRKELQNWRKEGNLREVVILNISQRNNADGSCPPPLPSKPGKSLTLQMGYAVMDCGRLGHNERNCRAKRTESKFLYFWQ